MFNPSTPVERSRESYLYILSEREYIRAESVPGLLFSKVMKKSIISMVLSVLVFSNQLYAQSSDFRTGNYDYSKLNKDPEMIEQQDYEFLTVLASGDKVLRENLMQMIQKNYRKRSAPVIRNKTAPYLARVQSSYYDEATKKWETIQGLGSFVKVNLAGAERTALLSVSHLTQGQQLRIYDSENHLVAIQPGMRLANINKDVELIVLKDDVDTPLRDSEYGLFMTEPLDMKPWKEGMDIPDYDRIYVSKKQHVPIFKSLLPKNSAGLTFNSSNQSRENAFRKMLSEGKIRNATRSREGIAEMIASVWDEDGTLQRQLVGGGYIAGARLLPGLSGAPVIRDIPYASFITQNEYVYFIEGLVQGHHRIENKSYFVGLGALLNILKDFKSGKRGYTNNTRWRMKNRMTFRDFGNGVIETNMIKTPSGSFYKGDSGNAISVDGDFNPESFGFALGMQNGHDNNIVGQFVQIEGLTLPVLADASLKTYLPEGMEIKSSFGAKQDLYSLAKMKYQFRDQVADMVTPYECFVQVTDTGIDLQVNKFKGDSIIKWHGKKTDLQKGFDSNNMFVGQSKKPAVEISGLFFTDLTNVDDLGNPKAAGVPTVTVLPREGNEAARVGCFENPQQRKIIYNKYRDNFSKQVGEMLGKEYYLPPSPFGE